ncbi:GPI-anchored surface protein, putative, partial [Bodo saltans]
VRSRQASTATAQLLASVCQTCGSWFDDSDDSIELTLPESQCVYLSIEKQATAPSCACSCDVIHSQDIAPPDDIWAADREPILSPLSSVVDGTTRALVARSWFIHRTRPPHVHHLTWRQMSTSTRSQHIRWLEALRGFPNVTFFFPFLLFGV